MLKMAKARLHKKVVKVRVMEKEDEGKKRMDEMESEGVRKQKVAVIPKGLTQKERDEHYPSMSNSRVGARCVLQVKEYKAIAGRRRRKRTNSGGSLCPWTIAS